MRQSNDGMLGAMPVPRLVVTMSLPIMLSMLISAVYNLVDSVYVAQYSDEAFLALSYAYPIQMLASGWASAPFSPAGWGRETRNRLLLRSATGFSFTDSAGSSSFFSP